MSKKMKLKKANQLFKEAESLAKKSLLRWFSDWNGAAPLYEKAALMFKSCGENKRALTCFLKSAEANEKCDNLVMSGKNYEQAGKMLLDMKQFGKAVKVFDKGHRVFYEDGKPDRAMGLLIKAAETVEKAGGAAKDVKHFYETGIRIMMDNDKLHHGMRHFNRYNAYLLRNEMYEDTVQNVLRQKESFLKLRKPQFHNAYKANLAVIVTFLHKGDLEEAERHHDEFIKEKHGYDKSEECEEAERLLDLFDQRDIETYNQIKRKGRLKFIEPAFIRLARKIESMDHVKGRRVTRPSQDLDELFDGADDDDESNEERMEDDFDGEKKPKKKKEEEDEGEESSEEEDFSDDNIM